MRSVASFWVGAGLSAMISAWTWGHAVDSWKAETHHWQKLYEINRDCCEAEKKRCDGWQQAHDSLQKRYDDLQALLENF